MISALRICGSVLLTATIAVVAGTAGAERLIVYTAHQEFDSRVYLLRMDGSVVRYFHYPFFRLTDLEVVDGEVYVADAFAPRLDRLDLETGELEVIVDDWSLYYFYGVASDGTSFYLDEWDLNRYDLDGTATGTASFDQDMFGAAWDGSWLWTMEENGQVRCWDISAWPQVTAVPGNDFSAPSADCRGLFWDGEAFWSAESLEGAVGFIYRFDATGQVLAQWLEPAFRGWGACVVELGLFADGFESGDASAWTAMVP